MASFHHILNLIYNQRNNITIDVGALGCDIMVKVKFSSINSEKGVLKNTQTSAFSL